MFRLYLSSAAFTGFLPYIPLVILGVILILALTLGYVKAPPDQAYIISGLKRTAASW